MIRTLIIDDEPRNIKLLSRLIKDHCPQLEVTGTAEDLTEGLLLIKKLKPSLLLLDIEFSTGTIFPMLELLPEEERNFHVIFVTAHNTYATEAFKQHAIDYILKPVTRNALTTAVKRVEANIRPDVTTGISKLIEELRSTLHHQVEKIPLSSAEGILFVNKTDIIRCEASGRYTIFYMEGNSKLTITKTLKETATLLTSRHFFRTHHSHIINLDKIRKYHRRDGGIVELTDGSRVEVSSSRKDALLDILLHKDSH